MLSEDSVVPTSSHQGADRLTVNKLMNMVCEDATFFCKISHIISFFFDSQNKQTEQKTNKDKRYTFLTINKHTSESYHF